MSARAVATLRRSLSDIGRPVDMIRIFRIPATHACFVDEAFEIVVAAESDLDAARRARRRGGEKAEAAGLKVVTNAARKSSMDGCRRRFVDGGQFGAR